MKMVTVRKFHFEQLAYGRITKPRKIIEAEKIFLAGDEQPEAVR